MNGKLKGLALLAMASLMVAGCSSQSSAKTQETVVVNDDVQLESSLADSSLEVTRQKDIEVRRDITFSGISYVARDKRIYFNEDGKLYSLDLVAGEEKKLAELEAMEISDNGNWALSYEDGEVYIHNLKNGEMKLLENGSPEDSGFMSDEVAHFDYTTHLLSLMDVEKNETTTWDLSKYPDATISSIRKSGEDVYLAARGEEDGFGIYQLSGQGKIAPVVDLVGKDTQIHDFDMLQNGSVIFNGTYDGKTGVFYWEEKTNDVKQLISGGKDREGIWTPFYKLSPDESKIMFDMPVQIEDAYKVNVYMAELVDGQVTNIVRIMENADLFSVISYAGDWSGDSNTAYITTSKNNHEHVGNIVVFKVNE